MNRELRTRILDQIHSLGPIACHRLFGGSGFYRGARLFGILHQDRLYLRVDDESRAEFERHGMGPFQPYTDRPAATRFYQVPAEVLQSPARLLEWAARAVKVAAAGAAPRRRGARQIRGS